MSCTFKDGSALVNTWCCISNSSLQQMRDNPFPRLKPNPLSPEVCGSAIFFKDTYLEVSWGSSCIHDNVLGLSFRDKYCRDVLNLSKLVYSYEEATLYLTSAKERLVEYYATQK